MRTIYKYPVEPDVFAIDLPVNAQPLSVHVQGDGGHPQMWVLLDSEATKTRRRFATFGTGHRVPDGVQIKKFIGTFMPEGGALVFHLFEIE